MSILIEDKLKEIEKLDKYECWYLVKQDTDFANQCYYSSILLDYNNLGVAESLETYFEDTVERLNEEKQLNLSKNFRALRVSYYLGLITDFEGKFKTYNDAEETEVFKAIKDKTSGDFYKKELYSKIITQQIEKTYISPQFDERRTTLRKDYRIFPVIFLYKVLLELGKLTGEYRVSLEEYTFFILTTRRYKDYVKTISLILQSRENPSVLKDFKKYKEKLDNRFNLLLKQLDTINIEGENIYLKSSNISYVKELILLYEYSEDSYLDKIHVDLLNKNISIYNYLKNNFKRDSTSLNNIKKNEGHESEQLVYQKVYFGAPGTGKSYQLSEDAKKYFNDENISRVTFHSAYSYGSFVGSYKPFPTINNEITYKYVPGPFIKLITKALRNPNKNYLLIIEEINRADVSYIFGDIFQLLDRDCNGFSTYPIEISEDLKLYFKEEFKELKGEKKEYIVEVLGDDMTKLYIPNNMYIWATMNNADQGVHVLDTAFKRRWYFKGLGINNNEEKISEYRFNINDGTKVNWNKLRRSINNKLISVGVNEDKLLGTFFLSMNELNICQSSKGNFSFNDLFKNKVIMYLYEDLRHYRNEIFKDSNLTYEQLCTKFDDIGLNIFNDLEMNDEED